MNKKALALALLMAAAPATTLGASVYKWTDESGVTHFGDRQPNGKAAEKVNVRSGTSAKGNSDRQSPQEQLNDLQEQQQSEQKQQRETAVEEARRKQREANCATARSNLEMINSNARIRVEEDGEQRYLSPEEIVEQRDKFQQIADENCGSDAGADS